MLVTYRFLLELIFRSIYKNFIRSSTIIVTTILVLSSSIALLGWIEVSPVVAVDKTFSERGYEIQVSQIFFNSENFPRLKLFLETEPLVESSAVIYKSMLLYNLNTRNPGFNILSSQDSFDFYMSTDYTHFTDGVYFVSSDYIKNIESMLQFEAGSKGTFNEDNNGIVISRRMLNLIEQTCEHIYSVGDKIDFSVARSHLPAGTTNLGSLLPLVFSNMTITAIYDRTPIGSSPLEYTFYQETIGDGLFLSHSLLNQSDIDLMETNGFFPKLFVRIDRNKLAQLNSLAQVTPEIDNIASRITIQGFFLVNTQNVEINSLLYYYDRSQLVVIFLLLPLVIISEILFIVLVRRLVNDQTLKKLQYLHLRGNSDSQIFFIEFGEFFILNLIGIIGGVIGGFIFIDVLLTTSSFLTFSTLLTSLGAGIHLILNSQASMFVIGVLLLIFLNFTYFYYRFAQLIASLQQLKSTEPSDRIFLRTSFYRNSVILIGSCLIFFIIFRPILAEILKKFGFSNISLQLIPLILVIIIAFWILFSFFSPQYLLQFFQSFLESFKIFKNPRRKLTWLSLIRRKAQYLSLMALLALTVSLTAFSLIYFQSLHVNSVKNANYLTGGDLKVITDRIGINSFTTQVEQIEGVASCLGFSQFEILTAARYMFILMGIDPDSYYEISPIEQQIIVRGPSPEELWHETTKYNVMSSVIVSSTIADIFQWEIGSNMETLGFPGYNARYDFTVRAIIDSAPGIGPLYFENELGSFNFGGYAIVHQNLLNAFNVNQATTFLVRLQANSDSDSVINQIRNLSPSVRRVFTSSHYLQSNLQFLQFAGVQGILTLNILGTILISLIGISTMYQCLLDERLTEFAVFRTLGATKRGITRLMIKEASVLSAISISIGVISGILFGFGFLITSRGVTVPPHSAFLLELILPYNLIFASIILVLGIVLCVNFIYVRRISKLQINTILRGE